MKIVTDTHFFYYLGKDTNLFEGVANLPIAPNLYNVLELCSTTNLINFEEDVREAHRRMIYFKEHVIIEPPFQYIAKLSCGLKYHLDEQFGNCFEFSSAIASGEKINSEKLSEFETWSKNIRSNGESTASILNNKLEEIRPNIIDKKAHRRKDTTQITMALINSLVNTATGNQCDLIEKDLTPFELLIKVWGQFFKEVEVSHRKVKPNDIADLLILAYVQPGDKFWTNEKFWIRMINEAGCVDYLFKL